MSFYRGNLPYEYLLFFVNHICRLEEMENLPTEILTRIFQSLDPIAMINVGSTNRRFRTIVFNNEDLKMRQAILTVGSCNNTFYFISIIHCTCTEHDRQRQNRSYCCKTCYLYHPMISKSFVALIAEVRWLCIEWHNDRVSVIRVTNLIDRLPIKKTFGLTLHIDKRCKRELQSLANDFLVSLKQKLDCNCSNHLYSCNRLGECECSPLACPDVRSNRNSIDYHFHCDIDKSKQYSP